MAETAPDPVNIAVIASAVGGSVVIIVTIIVIVCVIGYCYERMRSASDTRSRAESRTNHQSYHHNRRRRRRRGHDQREEREGEDPREDVHLEDSELQPHPPPPSYSRVHQYSSIDVDLNLVTQQDDSEENGTTRVSMYIGDAEVVQDEDTIINQNEMVPQVGPPQRDTLPPTYSTAQMETGSGAGTEEGHINSGSAGEESELTSQSRSAGVGGSLPPSYSTARMELMRIRAQNSVDQGLSNDDSS